MEFSEGFDYEVLAAKYCPQIAGSEGANQSQPMSIYDCANITSMLEYYEYDASGIHKNLPEKLFVPAVFGVTFAVGLVGNGLVIYVVLRSGAMKTVTNLFLCNLAVSDLIFLMFCVPFTGVTYVLPNWPFGKIMCKTVNYIMMVTMATGVMTMTAMSIDRYHAVVRPIRSKIYRTVKRTLVVLSIIWAVNLTSLLPVAYISRLMTYYDLGVVQNFCVEYFPHHYQRRIYTMSVFICYYACPLFVIATSYQRMAKNLWNSVSPGFLQENTARALNSRRHVSKMVLVIVSVFAACWLPIHCIHLNNDFGHPSYSQGYYTFKIVAHCMCYMNGAINPIIYGFMSENFRQCFKQAFTWKKGKPRSVFIVADPEALPGSRSRSSEIRPRNGSSESSGKTGRNGMSMLTTGPPRHANDVVHQLVVEDIDTV